MSKHIVAIVNPVSGRRRILPVIRHIGRVVAHNGGQLDIETTDHGGQATSIAASLPPTVDAVLVVGGDGTVCEVVNGLIERPIPITILRAGTENLVARELKMPAEPNDVARALLFGEPVSFDIGVANGRRFIAIAGVGFDAECVERMSKTRHGHITHGDYFWPVWRTFWSHGFPRISVIADGELVFEGRGLALVGIIRQYSIGLELLCKAKYDDGLLDLCVLPCTSRLELVGHIARAFRRKHADHPEAVYRQCSEVSITSGERVPIEIDGDLGGELPLSCTILPAAATFLR